MRERRFTVDELERLAKWERLDLDFCPTQEIEEAATKVRRRGYACKTSRENDLATYFSAFVHEPLNRSQKATASHHHPIRLDGVVAYFNVLVPVAALARGTVSVAADFVQNEETISSCPGPDLAVLLDPVPGVAPTVDAILFAFEGFAYHFWTKDALKEPLPSQIKPYEYCLGGEPWDRVFHVLFANTD